jgi:hypothetical protein
MQIILYASVLLSIAWSASASAVRTFCLLIDLLYSCLYSAVALPQTITFTAQYVVATFLRV